MLHNVKISVFEADYDCVRFSLTLILSIFYVVLFLARIAKITQRLTGETQNVVNVAVWRVAKLVRSTKLLYAGHG